MRVTCEISRVTLQNGAGHDVEGVTAFCTRCEHSTESFGTGDSSIRRCLVLLREECPNGEKNFYVQEGD